ncbi:MAG: DUF1648 domain-containing protein [Senegalia sp. (in: firmicutes)]|uniref:DUF1648 domain-containing protein n=1 Tax=Bacillota TaxID=1239 RepID=UPI003F971FCF
MIRHLLKKFFNIESMERDGEKARSYMKINIIVIIICFIWNGIMLFFLPEEIPMQWNMSSGEPTYTLPRFLGAWAFPAVLLLGTLLLKVQNRINIINTVVIIFTGLFNIVLYGYLAFRNVM